MPTTEPNIRKVERVAELKERIDRSDALLLTEYRGLTVSEITELRRSLAEGGTKFAVVKNTLMRRAVNDAGVAELESLLEGPSAIAFVQGDPVAAAKSVVDAAKKFPTLVLKGGFMDGKLLSADDAKSLASLESREVMLSKIAGMLKSEMSRAAATFVGAQSKFLGVLEAYKAKLPAEEAAAEPSAEEAADEPPPRTARTRKRPERGSRGERRERSTRGGGCGRRGGHDRGGVGMAKLSNDDLLDKFKEMTLLELSEFIKQFEETFDVTAAAAAPVVVAGGGAAAAGGEAAAEEQDEFDVVLTGAGDKKIQVIKEVRALTSLGLKEAKDLVDGAPKPVLEKVNKETADQAKEQLEGAGATVEVK